MTAATNVTAYTTWGNNGEFKNVSTNWAVDGNVVFQGSSGWYAMTTIESYSGQWNPPGQQTYRNWFKANAFGGTNYLNTPVGGTSTVEEPSLGGKTQVDVYFRLWSKGKSLGLAAWVADGVSNHNSPDGLNHLSQTSGDPLTSK